MPHSYISYWEHDVWLKDIDIAIIGSGIVGLTSAYFLKQKYPQKKIVVIERGFLPHGATTRNAGFSCFGSVTEILSDIKKTGKENAYKLVNDRFDGLDALLKLHHPDTIHYENLGGYEIFTQVDQEIFENSKLELADLNKDLQDVLKIKSNVYQVSENLRSTELGLKNVIGMFFNPWEGQIHSGLLIKNLIRLCKEVRVEIITGLEILSFEKTPHEIQLKAGNNIEIKTQQLLITTNGFARQLLPELDVSPARGHVLVTSPIEGLLLKGTFHHHEGFDYFRNIGNRVLLGGGRNLDMEAEESVEMESNDKISSYLLNLLNEIILPTSNYSIEHEWTGIMGVGEVKSPIIKEVHDRIYVAVRMGGMGVAIGTNVASKVASLI